MRLTFRRADDTPAPSDTKPEQHSHDASTDLLAQNVQTVADLIARREARLSPNQRFIEDLTRRIGRPRFLYANLLFITVWITANSGLFGPPFDEPPFFWLGTMLAIESILVTGMVLISQNRQSMEAERRAQLDLQINILSEQKITKILTMLETVISNQDRRLRNDPEVKAMQEMTDPEILLTALEFAMERATAADGETSDPDPDGTATPSDRPGNGTTAPSAPIPTVPSAEPA